MLYIDINGHRLLMPAGATAQVVHKNALFTDGLEDSFSLPIELPAEGNEATLGHVHELPLSKRTTKFTGARLGHGGLPLYPGTLHVLSSTPRSVRATFSLEGFVDRIRGVMLPDTLREELIDLTDELLNQNTSLHIRPLYADGGKCQFPMYRNTELYGDANPDWYPSASAWSATQSYAVNDLVEYTEVANGMVRTDIWQCISPSTGGLGPAGDPTHWRRTAFGLVNAWDRASNQHHYNTTDGNFYSFVPWFYLKWVLKKALAHVGYTPVGEFMDDDVTHELVLANNTTIDAPSQITSDYAFRATQTAAVTFMHDGSGNPVGGWESFRITAQNDSTLSNYDPSGVWNTVTQEWECPAAGTFRFRIRVTMNQRANDRLQFRMHRSDGSLYAIFPYVIPAAEFAQGGGYSPSLPLTVVHEFPVVMGAGEVGDEFYFVLHQTTSPDATGVGPTAVMFPNSIYAGSWGAQQMSNIQILGWLENAAPTVCVPDTEIRSWRHMPDVEIYGLLVAVADAFNLSLEPDQATRTLRMDYKENELREAVRRTTDHSARLVNEQELDHQRAVRGVRLSWDVEKAEIQDLASVENATISFSEDDMSPPQSTGLTHVALATRSLYRSVLQDGVYGWKHVGYHVLDKLVGEKDSAKEVRPALRPVHMVQEQLDSKEYLIPELKALGTSAWFHTEGDRSAIWISEFKHQRSSDGTVTNVPGARSWGYGWSPADRSRLTLLWDQADSELPGAYQRWWQRWLGMLTTAEPVTCDLLVDPAFLKGRDWRHTLHLHSQHYLVQEMPVEYGTSDGELISRGAYLLRLRPQASEPPLGFRCEGPQYLSLYATEPLAMFVTTSTGYLAVREADGTITVYGEGDPEEPIEVFDGPEGQLCIWPSNAEGQLSGEAITLQMLSNSRNAVWRWWETLVMASPLIDSEEVDIRGMYALEYLEVLGACTYIRMGVHPVLAYVSAVDTAAAISNTDEIINALNADIPDGYLDLSGGTSAPRTSASDTNYAALVANGWTIILNP